MWDLNERLKVSNDGEWRMASGRLFQARGPATAKAGSPSVDLRVTGVHHQVGWCHWPQTTPWFHARHQTGCLLKVAGADPWRQRYTSTQSLYCIPSAIRSQWIRSTRRGEMWLWCCAPTVRRAAALMTDCSRSRSQRVRPTSATLQ